MDRRHFLTNTLGAAVAGVAGCCATAPPIVESETTTIAGAPLAPTRVNTANRSTSKVLDAHCHIFNATDLQVAGYLAGPVAFTLDEKIRWIVQGLARPVEFVSRNLAISATDEMQRLEEFAPGGALSSKTALAASIHRHREDAATALFDRLARSDYVRDVNELLSAQPAVLGESAAQTFNVGFVLDAFSTGATPYVDDFRYSVLRQGRFSFKGLLAFVGFMLSPRFMNLIAYQEGYTTEDGTLGVDGCFASTVDLDYWLGCCDHTRSLMRDQVLLMQRISTLSGGYIRPLVGYNPWTDIEDQGASLGLVEEAISERGFVGVKIYPSMGYFPYRNAGNDHYPTDGRHPPLEEVDRRLDALYALCRRYDVPVMSHSGESMGRLPSHDVLGGPIGWTAFFDDSKNAGTRINLGHMGGAVDKTADSGNWSLRFARLMSKPTANYLYGDLGFWDEIVVGDRDAIARLQELLNMDVSNGDKVEDRVMFGTDWLMLAQTGVWSSYAVRFQKVLADSGFAAETLEKLFHRNAARLFDPQE